MQSLSVVLPAFNEAQNIQNTVGGLLEILPELVSAFEVIVVDDGSRDSTRRLAEDYARRDARVRTLHHPHNRGYGAALKSGILASRMEYIFFTDADGQFDLDDLRGLLHHAGSHDIIAGYREQRSDPWPRRMNGMAWGMLVDGLFDLGVRDVDCAFKVFHRRVFERIPIFSVGAFVNTEILVRARAEGFSIDQVPVRHFPRRFGRQSGADLQVVAKAFAELWRLYGDLKTVQGRPELTAVRRPR